MKAKQKLGVTFNSDKLGGIDYTKFSKLSMCSAGAGWYNGLDFLLGTALWVEGGSKQNGVRMHATDYEIYVSKYLLQ